MQALWPDLKPAYRKYGKETREMNAGVRGKTEWRQVLLNIPIIFGILDFITCNGGDSQGMIKHRISIPRMADSDWWAGSVSRPTAQA